jgi:hypothetical protein
MAQQKTTQIKIVIADAGPLISLAHADALDTLLVFKEGVRLIITDFVEFEITRHRDQFPDAKLICEFIRKNAGIVEIQETSIGKATKQMVQMREMFEDNEQVRQMMISNNSEPPQVPSDIGELSIVSFIGELIKNPPGTPVLILAEDDFFLRSGAATPGNAHVLSTHAFLNTLSSLRMISSASIIWDEIQRKRPMVNTAVVDRPAAKINTDWTSTIDGQKAGDIETNQKVRRKARERGGQSM